MFHRAKLKEQAKEILKQNYWVYLGVTSIVLICSSTLLDLFNDYVLHPDPILPSQGWSFYISLVFDLSLFGLVKLLITIFINYPLLAGQARVFLDGRNKPAKTRLLFSCFDANYLNVVKIMVIMNIKIYLWTCLFIIPGIIKAYEYYWIPYILASRPNISTSEAFALSKELSTNAKFDTFVLELSFLGWIFLGMLCCGIGLLFILPYTQATYTEAYVSLCENHGISAYPLE